MIKKILFSIGAISIALVAIGYWSYADAVISVPTDQKWVALTYDDGPNPPDTQALLKVLDKHQVKATFFMKGRNVEAFPEAVRAVAAAGHEIGNHSYEHKPMLSFAKTGYRDEILKTNRALKRILNYSPTLFRPPYGAQGVGLKLALQELQMKSIIMGAAGSDWEETDPRVIADTVLADVHPGTIILLHDGHGDVQDPDTQNSRSASVTATELIIEALHARGYQITTVGELLKK
jgi:peptidoglycan/xylan/chitin deacetylase (PgdA/CDA1 family)